MKTFKYKQLGSSILFDKIRLNKTKINDWLSAHEAKNILPLYSSVDIRNAGFKMAVVDTNLFPAGFNNLCEHGITDAVLFFKKAILKRVDSCKNVLIIAEEHTRNVWYLENVRILNNIIVESGFNCKIATFLDVQPSFCENTKFVEIETSEKHTIRIHCLKKILDDFRAGTEAIDFILMNNDLTKGIPEILKNSTIPIYPSIHAGWHSRLKSHHFDHTFELMNELGSIIDLDPWFFTCLYDVVDHVDINDENSRKIIFDKAQDLFKKIHDKYDQYKINDKPYIIIKSDSGTYGMSVITIEDPSELLVLNRKLRNKLNSGKEVKAVQRFLIQEGVPTIYNIDNLVSEACIYQIENNLVGGFYRSHEAKTVRQNLNSKGMIFKKMCPQLPKYGTDCGVDHDLNIFDIYRILARVAAIAAHREIVSLKTKGALV